MQITFGLRHMDELNRQNKMCLMDNNFQITDKFPELNVILYLASNN